MKSELLHIPHFPKPLVGYRQTDDFSCGLAVTTTVLHYFGDNARFSRIKRDIGTCRSGTKVDRIISRISQTVSVLNPEIAYTHPQGIPNFNLWKTDNNTKLLLDCFAIIYDENEDHYLLSLGGNKKKFYVFDVDGESLEETGLKVSSYDSFIKKYKFVYPILRSIRNNGPITYVF